MLAGARPARDASGPMADQALPQPPILTHEAPLGRVLIFDLAAPELDPEPALRALVGRFDPARGVLGMGEPLCAARRVSLPGLRTFPALSGPGCSAVSTQSALCCLLAGADRGELLHRGRALAEVVSPAFVLAEVVDTFTYDTGRDLSGYIDGTENPTGDDAVAAAIVRGQGEGLDGGSYVAIQRWVHDLDSFEEYSPAERDDIVGRSLETNEELDGAPDSAHVKRSAQESFEPEAFMLRRSMPFVTPEEQGLVFIAYGESLDRYERVLRRMLGLDDGVVDALFRFTRPVTGGYYFCPPVVDGRVSLRCLGL